MVYSEAQRTDNFKMMKKIAIIACTACCGITAVQPQAEAEVAEAAVLPADEAELMVNEVITILKEMATILESFGDSFIPASSLLSVPKGIPERSASWSFVIFLSFFNFLIRSR